ncbi:uncharacterized protein LOC122291003 [Carya illinoinensis]|uniref:uncharacterized protein LOC122291003 n=1 Tax=Carya illinoinensis TaxID=32201 RepID=UPI001C7265B0|nr:uncharacterized protein LOC122291003 [Carya illinoinensis]
MSISNQEAEFIKCSNRERIEVLEGVNTRVMDILSEVNTTMAELRMAMNATTRDSEEHRRAMETMRRETHESIERIERRLVEGQAPRRDDNAQRRDAFVDGVETSVTESLHDAMHEPPRVELRRGGRVEHDDVAMERWIYGGSHHRSPSTRGRHHDVRYEMPRNEDNHGAKYGYEEERPWGHENRDDRRPLGHENREERRPHYYDQNGGNHGRRFDDGIHDERRGNRTYDRGPKRPKVDFPKFNGGDPYEWLDKVDHYFRVYDVPRRERVSTACFYLEGKASKWWRWIRDQYEKDEKRLGWTAFEKEFLMQFGPSPIVNHHGQLEKLKQEGKVHHYIEEFRQLQTLVRGWSKEALIGTFVDGLKPWLAKEIKLNQPRSLQEVMRMAEILEESTHIEKRHSKDMGSKVSKPLQTKVPWKDKEGEASASKPKPYEVKKLSREEVQERIKKGLCFKCGDKWSKEHKCRAGQAYVLLEDGSNEVEDETHEETSSEELKQERAESSESLGEAELSLNAISGVPRPTSMRVMVWVGKFEVTLLVDSGSTHNFVNSNIVTKIGLKSCAINPFEVKVANGDKLKCEEIVREVKMNIQGVSIVADLHVLALGGLDIVLGNAWLRSVGKVLNDYEKMTMKFKIGSKKKVWTALSPKEIKSCEALVFEKLYKGGAYCVAIVVAKENYLCSVEKSEEEGNKDELEGLPVEVREVLEDHRGVLEVPYNLPPSRIFDHRIVLVDEKKPVNVPPYRYAHFQKGEIERQVDEMLKNGLIRPSTSPFSSPVLLVRKKDGTWRFCTDYRALNEATVKDRFPIPTVDEMLDELHGARIFSKLDLRAGYHQIRMKSEDIHKTAFRTHSGNFEYLVMPFGLCNAPSTFQAAMDTIFKPLLRKFVLVFFDDILVYSKTIEEHKSHLRVVLRILEEHHFFIKASKCAFMERELEYLGHFISGEGVKVDQRKIEAMVEWPLPHDVSALRGFLGLTSYYRRFVKNYGLIAKPLTSLLKKDNFAWTQEAMEAFDELKRAMTTTPVLALPNFEKPFEVYTDVSGEGIGAVLVQEKRPIAFISKALGPMKKAWSTYAREMLAVVHAVKVWRPYLLGRKFTIVTDQQALRHMLKQKIVTPEQQKFLVKLLG